MSNKNSVKEVGGKSIGERVEMDEITKRIDYWTEGDNDAGECVMTTALFTNNKEEDIDAGNVMEKLGKLTNKSKCVHQ